MATLAEKRNRQRKLMSLAMGALIIGGMILYFGVFRESSIDLPNDEIARRDKRLKRIIINDAILKDIRFIGLIPYDRLPTDIETGRVNPFSPY